MYNLNLFTIRLISPIQIHSLSLLLLLKEIANLEWSKWDEKTRLTNFIFDIFLTLDKIKSDYVRINLYV